MRVKEMTERPWAAAAMVRDVMTLQPKYERDIAEGGAAVARNLEEMADRLIGAAHCAVKSLQAAQHHTEPPLHCVGSAPEALASGNDWSVLMTALHGDGVLGVGGGGWGEQVYTRGCWLRRRSCSQPTCRGTRWRRTR